MEAPNYLVLTKDGKLHAYWRAVIVRCHVSEKKEDVTIFERTPEGMTLSYKPVSLSQLYDIND